MGRRSRGGPPRAYTAKRLHGRRIPVVAVLLLVVTVVVGCSRSQGRDVSSSAMSAQEKAAFLTSAEDEMIRRCMEQAGFEFAVSSGSSSTAQRGRPVSQWGTDDVAWAQQEGYGFDGSEIEGDYVDPNAETLAGLSVSQRRAWELAYRGRDDQKLYLTDPSGTTLSVSSAGCEAKARAQVYGSLEQYFRLTSQMMQIPIEQDQRVEADPAYGAVLDAWAACMEDAGYHFSRPGDAMQAASEGWNLLAPAAAKAQEIEIAVADATCGKSTRLVQITSDLEVKYAKALDAQNEGAVLAFNEMQDRAVERAKRLLGQGEG